jgi:ankyrin repeat protein
MRAAGSWFHAPDQFGQTALHYAVMADSAPAVEELLSWRGCDVNVRTNDGTTPLHVATANGFVKVARLLIDAGADVNAVVEERPGDEETVLRIATLADKPDFVQLLLKGRSGS